MFSGSLCSCGPAPTVPNLDNQRVQLYQPDHQMNRESPVDTAKAPDRRSGLSSFPWSTIGALIFLCLLWILDFPNPMCDDLFYSGAGLNLASGGDLSNPLLARQHLPGHLFLVYPPVHSYVLAGWLKVL